MAADRSAGCVGRAWCLFYPVRVPPIALSFVALLVLAWATSDGRAAPADGRLTPAEVAAGERSDRILVRPRAVAAAQRGSEDVRRRAWRQRQGMRVRRAFPRLGGVEVIQLPPGLSVARALEAARGSGLYAYAEPDRVYTASATVPDDPLFASGALWGLNNTGQSGGLDDADVDAPEGWDAATSANGTVVAVIDTGIRTTHEDLAANLWTNPGESGGGRETNGIDDDANGYVDDVHGINAITGSGDPADDNGHGTHCAGTIGGVGNNGLGIVGVAWSVRLMACKFLDDSGSGSSSDAIECIDYARAHGARVMSNSWGGPGFSLALQDAIAAARDAGAVFVAAAGNDASNIDGGDYYPANYALANVISVAASTRTDTLASYSNHGYGFVELAAPGSDIQSALHTSNAAYGTKSGTSMATPHVAGALALLAQMHPGDSPRSLIHRVLRGVDPVPGLAGKVRTGGRLNLAGALAADATPGNDHFAAAAALPAGGAFLRASNENASVEFGEPAHAGIPGGDRSVWWTWTATGAGRRAVGLAGSDFDTVLAVYTGDTLAALAPVVSNDDAAPGNVRSRVEFEAIDGITYRIAVASKSPDPGGFIALRLGSLPANDRFADAGVIDGVAASATGTNVNAGKEPDEAAHAGQPGGASVWWTWEAPATAPCVISTAGSSFDSLLAVYTGPDPGNLTLVTSNDDQTPSTRTGRVAFDAVAGTVYRIAVDGREGASGTIRLELGPPPANDLFANRIALPSGDATASAGNALADLEPGEPGHAGNAGGGSLWWSWTAPADGTYEVNTIGSDFDTLLAVYEGTSPAGLLPVADDDRSGVGNTSRLAFGAVAGTTYQIAVDGANDGLTHATGAVTLRILAPPPPPANDLFAAAVLLEGFGGSVTGTNAGAGREPGEPEHGGDGGGRSVWWMWVAPGSGPVVIDTNGSDYDSLLGVYTGDAVDGLALVAGDDDSGDGLQSRVTFNATAGTIYRIAVDGWGADHGFITLNFSIDLPNTPPVVSAATVTPAPVAYSDQPLTVIGLDYADPQDDPVTLAFQWQSALPGTAFVDQPGATDVILPADPGRAGKLWRCRVTASDPSGPGMPFATESVSMHPRPSQVARHGEPYLRETDLFVPGNATVYSRAAIINEFSQGPPAANREWTEILFLRATDARGWSLRDAASQDALTFTHDARWAALPAGALVVLYRSIQKDATLPPDDFDPSDGVAVIGSSNTTLLNGTWPFHSNVFPDGIHLRNASGGLVDGLSFNGQTSYHPRLANVTLNQSAAYLGDTEPGADLVAQWAVRSAANGTVTPALGNGGFNSALVAALRAGVWADPPRYRFHVSSDLVPGLALDPHSGVLAGIPDVPAGGLFDLVIERYTATTSVLHPVQLLVGNADGVFTVPHGASWTLSGNQTLHGTLVVNGALDGAGFALDIVQTFESWKAARGMGIGGADDGDADGHGLFLEYALDLDPASAEAGAATPAWVDGRLRLSFRRQKAPSELRYRFRAGVGLEGAQSFDVDDHLIGVPIDLGPDIEQVTIEDPSVNSPPARFLWLEISRP